MAGIFTFMRPFRYHSVRNILVVQSGSVELTMKMVEYLRTLFAESTIKGVVCEEDAALLADQKFDRLIIVRWEDRFNVLKRLRAKRYDVVAALYCSVGSHNLKLLPLLLRTRYILMFNENIDYFPLTIWHFSKLTWYASGSSNIKGLLLWALARFVLTPLAAVFLLGSVIFLYARGVLRRLTAPIRT